MSITVEELAAQAELLQLPPLGSVGDDGLMGLQRRLASIRRFVDTASADVAAEIATRSRRELGYGGLAQRVGARTPERLVQSLTGSSIRDARALVEVGRMIAAPAESDAESSEQAIAVAVRSGALSIEQARAIDVGLGPATCLVADERLHPAREELLALAPIISVEDLRAHARVLRDELDTVGVADREAALRDSRFLKLYPQDDGMMRLAGLLDPESAARVRTVVDAALSPRRGGPRFVDREDRKRAERLESDPRTDDQIALDTIVELLDAGVASREAGPLVGRNGAPVHVLVTSADLASGSGFARIAGQDTAISVATAERAICTDGMIPIQFDAAGKDVLRLGSTRRRFSAKQRTALVARDGCCRKCGRPVSQTEAHHIIPVSHGGPTDLENAILLCRFDHLLVHNNGWRIDRDARGDFWFIPPPDVDPLQRRIPAHPPDPVIRRLTA